MHSVGLVIWLVGFDNCPYGGLEDGGVVVVIID